MRVQSSSEHDPTSPSKMGKVLANRDTQGGRCFSGLVIDPSILSPLIIELLFPPWARNLTRNWGSILNGVLSTNGKAIIVYWADFSEIGPAYETQTTFPATFFFLTLRLCPLEFTFFIHFFTYDFIGFPNQSFMITFIVFLKQNLRMKSIKFGI